MEHYEQYIGKTLSGKYVIEEMIGLGGMSYVFKAKVIETEESVAVKILNEESARNEESVKRFINESKAVSMLSHKNIVKIYDVAFESDINYIVMEYVDGITLKEYIDYKKTLEWGEAVYYVSQILKALGHAHATGIVHRDVKPQNVMITRDGVIKVMDFGIAKMLGAPDGSITKTDMALGTVDYISPEQASAKKVGFSSDIYSVGVMLYEMTTGRLPFIAETPVAVAMMQVQDEPQPPREINPSLPRGLEQIILKAMHKAPDERFSSCASMDKALELVVKDPTTLFTEHTNEKKKEKEKEKEKKKKESRRPSFLPIIAGVTIAFFLAAAGTAIHIGIEFYNTQFVDTGEDIRIPELIGKQYGEELRTQLSEDRFEIEEKYGKYDPEKQTDEIIGQTPDGGTTRKLSNPNSLCHITLILNPPPSKIVLDDYRNCSAQSVIIQLNKIGLSYTTAQRNDDTIVEGFIIGTEPAPGTTVEKGENITLYVSSGAALETTKVPKLIGLSVEEAKKVLQENDISIGDITYEDSAEPAGTVISASHAEDEPIPRKIVEVSLFVSLGNLSKPDEEHPLTPGGDDEPEQDGTEPDDKAETPPDRQNDENGEDGEGGEGGQNGDGTAPTDDAAVEI